MIFTLIAVGVGFAIALACALLAYRFGWVEEMSQKHGGLKSIADLKKAGPFTLGGPPEDKTRFDGVVGLPF